MEPFAKKVNVLKITIFKKCTILHAWQGSECGSDSKLWINCPIFKNFYYLKRNCKISVFISFTCSFSVGRRPRFTLTSFCACIKFLFLSDNVSSIEDRTFCFVNVSVIKYHDTMVISVIHDCSLQTIRNLRAPRIFLRGSSQNLVIGLVKDESTWYFSALIMWPIVTWLIKRNNLHFCTFEDFNLSCI